MRTGDGGYVWRVYSGRKTKRSALVEGRQVAPGFRAFRAPPRTRIPNTGGSVEEEA